MSTSPTKTVTTISQRRTKSTPKVTLWNIKTYELGNKAEKNDQLQDLKKFCKGMPKLATRIENDSSSMRTGDNRAWEMLPHYITEICLLHTFPEHKGHFTQIVQLKTSSCNTCCNYLNTKSNDNEDSTT